MKTLAGTAPSAGVTADMTLLQAWRSRGPLFTPDRTIDWLAGGAGAFFPQPLEGDRVRFFITGRDTNVRSRIGAITLDWNRPSDSAKLKAELVFDLGEAGTFDMDGVSYPWIVARDDALYMYYVGWNRLGGDIPFRNQIGLAVSTDGGRSFQRVTRAPLLPLSDAEPIGSGSCCILPTPGGWMMYYTNFLRWECGPKGAKHYYHIRRAYSKDGITWERPGEVIVDLIAPHEYALGAPAVMRLAGRDALFFTARGDAYKLFVSVQNESGTWVRLQEAIELPRSGFDSEMQCYPRTMSLSGKHYLLYSGNGYGREGIGFAEWTGP